MVNVKVILGDDIRRMNIPRGCFLSELEDLVITAFEISSVSLAHKDKDGDLCRITNEKEWQDLLSEKEGQTIRLICSTPKPSEEIKSTPTTTTKLVADVVGIVSDVVGSTTAAIQTNARNATGTTNTTTNTTATSDSPGTTSKKVIWEWKRSLTSPEDDDAAWMPYNDTERIILETAFQIDPNNSAVVLNGFYSADLTSMFQYQANDPNRRRRIRRREMEQEQQQPERESSSVEEIGAAVATAVKDAVVAAAREISNVFDAETSPLPLNTIQGTIQQAVDGIASMTLGPTGNADEVADTTTMTTATTGPTTSTATTTTSSHAPPSPTADLGNVQAPMPDRAVPAGKKAKKAAASEDVLDGSGHIHENVICDVCGNPVIGVRFKCLECPDYDLCRACELAGHHSEHVMVRMVKPAESYKALDLFLANGSTENMFGGGFNPHHPNLPHPPHPHHHLHHPHDFMHHNALHHHPHHHMQHHMHHNSSNSVHPNYQPSMSYAPQYPIDQASSSTTTTTAAVSTPLRTLQRDPHRNVPELHNLKVGMVGSGAVQLNTALEKCNTLQASQLRRPDMDMIEEATFEALTKFRPGCNEAMLADKQHANSVRDLVSAYVSNVERPDVRQRGRRGGRGGPRHSRHRQKYMQLKPTPVRFEEPSSTETVSHGKLYPDVDSVPDSTSPVAGSAFVPSSSSVNTTSFDVPSKFQKQVSQLVEMGFFDIKQLVDALEKHNGDFELTLAELLF